jgi:hypothetical protein
LEKAETPEAASNAGKMASDSTQPLTQARTPIEEGMPATAQQGC